MHTEETNINFKKLNAFCSIITFDYIPYVQALCHSLNQFQKIDFNVLISDRAEKNLTKNEIEELNKLKNLQIYYFDQLSEEGLGKELFEKYWNYEMDAYRWSMKPVFIKFLLEVQKYDKVIYADSDLYFFNNYDFLFDELENNDILLTPHWRSSDPQKDKGNFDLLFVGGLYNAGFIGVNKNAIPAMDWWAKVCLYQCIKDFTKGQYVDQTYLNLLPVLFDNVKIIKHKGCNIANWNQVDCQRNVSDGNVLIEGDFPIIFIHFTNSTINGILSGIDCLLQPFLSEYDQVLQSFGKKIKEGKIENKINKSTYKAKIKTLLSIKINQC